MNKKSFLSLSQLLGTRRKLLLLHGTVIHRFSPNQEIEEITREELYAEVSTKPKPVLLLAAPYLNSFVHETIPLSAKELENVDARILPFSISDQEQRQVTSISLNDKKAVTIHAHLSLRGKSLLNEFKNQKINVSWQPAVTLAIKNLLSKSKTLANQFSILRCYFHDEMLQIHWQNRHIQFSHIPYWDRHSSFENKRQLVDQLLQETIDTQKMSTIDLDCQSSQNRKNAIIKPGEIFFSEGRGRRLKSNQRNFRKDPINPLNYLTRNRILAIILAGCTIWAGVWYIQLTTLQQYYQQLKAEVQLLEQNTEKLTEIAKVERKYFGIVSLIDAVEIARFLPNNLFNIIETTLPTSAWIYKIKATSQIVRIELLDQKNTELSKLIEGFNQRLGKTNLEVNEKIELQKKPLNKYTIKIQYDSQVNSDE